MEEINSHAQSLSSFGYQVAVDLLAKLYELHDDGFPIIDYTDLFVDEDSSVCISWPSKCLFSAMLNDTIELITTSTTQGNVSSTVVEYKTLDTFWKAVEPKLKGSN